MPQRESRCWEASCMAHSEKVSRLFAPLTLAQIRQSPHGAGFEVFLVVMGGIEPPTYGL